MNTNDDINQESLEYLKTLSLIELRKRQDIINYQIPIAHRKHMIRELERLLLMQEQVDAAVYYIAFEKDKEVSTK